MLNDLKDAFANGVVGASTAWRKFYRWVILVALWLASAGCLALAFAAPSFGGSVTHGITFATSAVTLFVASGAMIFTFSSTEHLDRAMASMAQTRKIIRGGCDD